MVSEPSFRTAHGQRENALFHLKYCFGCLHVNRSLCGLPFTELPSEVILALSERHMLTESCSMLVLCSLSLIALPCYPDATRI